MEVPVLIVSLASDLMGRGEVAVPPDFSKRVKRRGRD